jgi:uncharacterized RDD family membrane protein YckC
LSILAPPLSGASSLDIALAPDREIGSLWRRVLACFIDAVVVGLAGFIVALPFFDSLSRIGAWGRLLGFLLSFPYFAILGSRVGNGQTLGKRVLHLQVADQDGKTVSLGRSALRYVVLAIPWFLNGLPVPITRTPSLVTAFLSMVVFGFGGITLYLVLFNRQTRQGIHDLVAHTYVLDADMDGPPKIAPIWRMHWVILASLLVTLSIGGEVLCNKIQWWGPYPSLLGDLRLIEGLHGVQAAGIQDLKWSSWSGDQVKTILAINVRFVGRRQDEEILADKVVRMILSHDPNAEKHDLLRVTTVRGYDLGIAESHVSQVFQHTTSEWKARLSEAPLSPSSDLNSPEN